jgi:hypothetical protein
VKKHTCLLFSALFLRLFAVAQTTSVPVDRFFNDLNLGNTMILPVPMGASKDKTVEGTPFALDEWTEGAIVFGNKTEVKKGERYKYKFNAYKNEIWVQNAVDQQIILLSNGVDFATIEGPEDATWRLVKVEIPDAGKSDYFVRAVYEGKQITLVQDVKKILTLPDESSKGAYKSGPTSPKFEAKYSYWIKAGDGGYEKCALKKGKLIDALPKDKQSVAEQYCKVNKLGGAFSEDEAIRLLQFLER